jgi:hypothetical protein
MSGRPFTIMVRSVCRGLIGRWPAIKLAAPAETEVLPCP